MQFARQLRHFVPQAARPFLKRRYHSWLARDAQVNKGKRALTAKLDDPHERLVLEMASSRIHPEDGMYTGDAEHYFSVGLSAMRCVKAVLKARPEQTSLTTALDLPCGFGRELRCFVHAWPETQFNASDIIREGVDFCVSEFGVSGVYSDQDIEKVRFEQAFDLIWCGSLITHLSDRSITALLRLFLANLRTGGVMILTTAGDHSFDRLAREPQFYGLTPESIDAIRRSYQECGFGFRPYVQEDEPTESELMERDYGITLTSPEWVGERIGEIGGLKEIYFKPQGWDNHLDVFGFLKA